MSESSVAGVSQTVRNVSIAGVVTTVPSGKVGNAQFEASFGTQEVASVAAMIGVQERRWVKEGETTADLCIQSARRLMASLGWQPADVGLLVFLSQTPDYALPATACVIHGKLGLSPRCASFDVNLGCSGYVYGLWLVGQLLQGGSIRRALLLVGDTSYYADRADRSTAMVFGDAGAATAIEYTDGAEPWHFVLGTDGQGAGNLIVPDSGTRRDKPVDPRLEGKDPTKLFMDGGEIFNFTLRTVPAMANQLYADAGRVAADYDAFLFHQANTFMLKHLSKKLKLPPDKTPINMASYGNTSSASIPLLMCDSIAGALVARRMRLAMFGFGVGYSWAAGDVSCGPLATAEICEL